MFSSLASLGVGDWLTTVSRCLRSALTSIGTLATDVTRRLDYTYYNLLEKITALNSTISSFQELSDSASTLLNDFEHETAGLDQDIRKQLNDLKGFEPQIQKADALEQRMKAGRQRVEELGRRLETVRHEIDSWEQREIEWQTRTSRRLRIFWGIFISALLVLVLALVLQNWPEFWSSHTETSRLIVSTPLFALCSTSVWGVGWGSRSPGKRFRVWYRACSISVQARRSSWEHGQGWSNFDDPVRAWCIICWTWCFGRAGWIMKWFFFPCAPGP
jgi:hypothetical protein